jgi:hypothetical protein
MGTGAGMVNSTSLVTGDRAKTPAAGGVALQTQQQHLQKVIEVQRSQLAFLQELVAQKKTKEGLGEVTGGGGGQYLPTGSMPSQSHMTSSVHNQCGGGTATPSSVRDRTQTFDYGNHSNKVLEYRAVQQLEKDSYYKDANRWP